MLLIVQIAVGIVIGGLALEYRRVWLPLVGRLLWALAGRLWALAGLAERLWQLLLLAGAVALLWAGVQKTAAHPYFFRAVLVGVIATGFVFIVEFIVEATGHATSPHTHDRSCATAFVLSALWAVALMVLDRRSGESPWLSVGVAVVVLGGGIWLLGPERVARLDRRDRR